MFSLSLKMKNLTTVSLDMSKAEDLSKDCCNYQGSKRDDRKIHRAGLCIIHLGTVFGHCPRLERFNGICIPPVFSTPQRPGKQFSIWNAQVKQLIYEDYLLSGGEMERRVWSRKRWFSKQPPVPVTFGKGRVPLHYWNEH